MQNRMTGLFLCATFYLLASCQSTGSKENANTGPVDTAGTAEHPAWSYQSSIYEVNLRQYSSEGTFKVFEKSLQRLKNMGVGILWFMPINPIGIEGRKSKSSDLGSYYAVRDYYAVNPEFGTMEEWKSLVKKSQAMGFKVILDWVPNHSSPDNPWIKAHPDFYKKDSSGHPAIPFDWSDTRQLDYGNREMRDSMLAAMKFWMNESHIDGFRCDVAWNVPDDFWKEAISSLRKIKSVFMLAEGEKPGLHLAGFDATYPWSVMNVAYGINSGKSTLRQLDSVISLNDSIYPKNSFRLYFTTNHDENSWNGTEFERFGDGYKTFAVWAFTMNKSIPLIYSGQEEPNRKRLKFFVKDTIQWGKYSLASFYEKLNEIRRLTPALAADAGYKKLTTGADEAVFSYLRSKDGHKMLVILNFSKQPQQFNIKDPAINGDCKNAFDSTPEKITTEKTFRLQPWGWLVYDYDSR
jgi:alpha-amylase